MITYELAQAKDAEEILEIYKLAGWWDDGDILDSVVKIIHGSFCFYVAKDNGKIIGMARAISDGVSDAYIQDVTVIKEYRRKRVGTQLVNTIKDFLLKSGVSWIGVISEPGAENLYPKLGFKVMEKYTPFVYKKGRKTENDLLDS